MRHLSIKARLVLLHTILMTLVIFLVLGILFSISSNEILSNVHDTLMTRVNESYEYISYEDGLLTFDNDFIEIRDNIYLSAYEPDDTALIYGKLPRGFNRDVAFEEGMIQEVDIGEVTYDVYDMSVPIDGYHTIIVRGVVSLTATQSEFQNTLRIALILLPLLMVLEVIIGYLLSKRAMAPVSKITSTVKDIRSSKDLSKRIALKGGSDEIYVLADTFDELLADVDKSIAREKSFTSDVAHELRTPIATMKLAIDDVLRHDLDQEVKDDIMIIKNKNDLMAKMISELLTLSRIDQGRLAIEKGDLDLSELTEVMTDEFKEVATNKGLTLESKIDQGIKIEADETLIIRLYTNVLENAIKFAKTKVDVFLKREDQKAIIEIKDDGIGIKEEDIPKIFDRFYQVDPSRNDKGSGLGLSMVKWILEVHDASYEVQSKIDIGTSFIFTFKIKG